MQEEPEVQLTERERKRQEREEATQQRLNEEKRLKAEYLKIAKTEAWLDLTSKVRSFADYHAKVAKDGVGFDESQNIVRLTPEQRVSELDRAAGIEEIIDYLERKTTVVPRSKKA